VAAKMRVTAPSEGDPEQSRTNKRNRCHWTSPHDDLNFHRFRAVFCQGFPNQKSMDSFRHDLGAPCYIITDTADTVTINNNNNGSFVWRLVNSIHPNLVAGLS
jgi:hypothetical protein